MKRNLQFLSMLLLMIVGGASFAWADVVSVTPTKEAYIRIQPNNNNTWKFTKKEFTTSSTTLELNYGGAGFFCIQQFECENITTADIICLQYTISGNDDREFGCWIYDHDYPTTEDQATLAEYMKVIMGKYPNAKKIDGTADEDSYTSPLATRQDLYTNADGKKVKRIVIQGEALSTLKSKIRSGNIINLVLTRAANDKTNIYSHNDATESYRPTLKIGYPITTTISDVTTGHLSLADAMTAVSSGGEDATITIYDDVEITSRYSPLEGKTLNIIPGKDGIRIFKKSGWNNSILFLNNQANSTLNIGDSNKKLIIDGVNQEISTVFIEGSKNGTTHTNLNNVVLKNCFSSNNQGIICEKTDGVISLADVSFTNCQVAEGKGMLFAGSSNLNLKSSLTFTNCIGYNIYLQANRFIRIGELSNTQVAPFTIYQEDVALGNVILSSSTGGDKSSLFQLQNENFGIVKKSDHYTDHVITEAYTMTMNEYGASTLILPYDATISSEAKAYTLNYSTGNANVKATEIKTGILTANTPVLVNADANSKIWFINTTNVAEATIGSSKHTNGALTGVYETTTVPSGSYVLFADATHEIGFYPAGSEVTVGANHAYLTAEGGSLARLAIVYGDETNAIEAVKAGIADDAIYTLSGVRVEQPTRGIYVKNGKKFIVK